MTQQILPGASLGVLGSGQLGRMFAIAARRLGYGVQVYSPDAQTPAGQVADREWCAPYDDIEALSEFAREVSVVTLEFENVSAAALNQLEKFVPVRPGPEVLGVSQNRLREKRALRSFGLPTAPFAEIGDLSELTTRLAEFGGRGVLKTASWGYDGKGQRLLQPGDDLESVWSGFAGQSAILEGFVDFDCELSVIAVRHPEGDVRTYAPITNIHRHHILDLSISPALGLSDTLAKQAREIATTIMTSLNVVGVLCVEMFLTTSGDLLVNEIAPRPHNSGHLTIDAHATCQFEQQVRSICGLPLGSTEQIRPAAMANLLGDLWQGDRQPNWGAALALPDIALHLYGKASARPGRKMGHLTVLGEDGPQAAAAARAARDSLT
ncbi:5-(carboxyamino)imidazole ribonucleotide synthase [Planctomicrobium sp. SH664]|uniref:5-(carboxyamino)imidazole ribonucleotide synthase n=1 Tax=Planctomicrobium sp. SH664 TaxID=3448125 RepID=UPI003F5B4C7F